ncbi:1-phosphofructokinase family hexose kinase [Selenomonas sp. F0473]|uniref:1-phosphofructokinase family hexose kinase n=1 Tax=Selenomonas sp. F0473 TaxID=999423 RepID=UPI00029E41F7|nr:1-phosphofructokinase [Selenomonas sp. F0473]EKU71937.1 1-phosphofructokinase family hexose kinase [Selenomonas sp. F0473]
MIHTLTTNPAIDMNISTNGLVPRRVNRTFDAVYTPNGKGLNVSFVLRHFGVPSRIMGFFGGFSGHYIVDESRKKGFDVVPVWVDDITRINIFLNDGTTEYKLVNDGALVPREKQLEMLAHIEELQDMTHLSVSGSLPQGISPDYYDEILDICRARDVRIILDISSPKLRNLLRYRPLLIKPNDEELEKIFGIAAKTEEDMLCALAQLHREGAQNILLTLGERGAYFSDGTAVYFAPARPVNLLSSACAGDAALAAFMSVWLDRPDHVEDALKTMAAVGANVAESNALGTLSRAEEYKKDIQVRRVR